MTRANTLVLSGLILTTLCVAMVLAVMIPQGTFVWLSGAAFLPIALITIRFFPRLADAECQNPTIAMIGAGTIILMSLLVAGLMALDVLPKVGATRIMCLAIGIAVLFTGDRLAKFGRGNGDSASSATPGISPTRRHARIQVLAGLTIVIASLALPAFLAPYAVMVCSVVVLVSAIAIRHRHLRRPQV